MADFPIAMKRLCTSSGTLQISRPPWLMLENSSVCLKDPPAYFFPDLGKQLVCRLLSHACSQFITVSVPKAGQSGNALTASTLLPFSIRIHGTFLFARSDPVPQPDHRQCAWRFPAQSPVEEKIQKSPIWAINKILWSVTLLA